MKKDRRTFFKKLLSIAVTSMAVPKLIIDSPVKSLEIVELINESKPSSPNEDITWFVDAFWGDDIKGDGGVAKPFKSFAKAYESSSVGDIINIEGSISNEN